MRVPKVMRRLWPGVSSLWKPHSALRQKFVPLEFFYWNPETREMIFRPDPDFLGLTNGQRAQIVYLAARILEEYRVTIPKPKPSDEPENPTSSGEVIPFGSAKRKRRT